MQQQLTAPVRAGAYSVSYDIIRPRRCNRLKVAFRLILAVPRLLLVGGGACFTVWFTRVSDIGWMSGYSSIAGLLGALLILLTVFARFAILITGRCPARSTRLLPEAVPLAAACDGESRPAERPLPAFW